MSKIEVDKVDPQSGTTLTLGTSGDTVSIPSGVTLANAGTATGFASIDWQSTVVTGATHTASANQGIWINTTSNACNLTLPSSPSVGDQLIFSDFLRTWGSNAVTLTLNGSKFQGNTSPAPVYDTAGETVHIVYSGSTQGWIPINDGAVTFETPQTYAIDYLVIAGGGSGGTVYNSGGGGAGGFRTSTQTLNTGTSITITVGDGGAAVSTGGSAGGNSGSNSSISGTGLTTITSAGGGAAGARDSAGANGGSGGGGSSGSSAGAGGSGNTPSTSPSQGNDGGDSSISAPAYAGGGGGGAGAVGADATSSASGNGGNGTASSITGSSVTRAGGGGGNAQPGIAAGSGGTGGGGAGNSDNATATSGTANTGGGGGGARAGTTSGAGGKGVIILSMPDADYSGTTTGSPTVATGVSGKTVLTFTGTGSYTT